MSTRSSKKGIDTHFHVFNAGEAVHGARYVPSYTASLPDWMAQARPVGITRGVWVQPSFLGTDNRLLVRALQAHPDVLRGIAVVDSAIETDQLQTLHDAGVRGIRLNLSGVSHDIPEWTRATPVWDAMQTLGWHVEVHTDSGALPMVLAQLPSDMPLVVDHMAKPSEVRATDASIAALVRRAQHAPTHVKLSGAYRLGELDATQLARLWLHELGAASLLWGSDWPCTNHEALAHYDVLLAALDDWVGSAHVEQVLLHNPTQLYGF